MAVNLDKSQALANLTLTPLIDVVFLLLIFFLVATKFADEERDERAAPRRQRRPSRASKPRETIVNIDQNGKYFLSGQNLSLAELERAARRGASQQSPAGPR